MRIHLARHLALAACLTLIGSVAEAAPGRRAGQRKVAKAKVALPVEDDVVEEPEDEEVDEEEEDEDDEEEAKAEAKPKRKRARSRRQEQVAASDDVELADAPPRVRKRGKRSQQARPWNFAIGPNVWAASVDANVAVGAKSVGTAIDFFQLSRATRFGLPVLVEARYKRFSFVGDVLYGVVDVNGENQVGPLMVTLKGTVHSLLVDGLAGYRVLDDEHFSLEARGGVRYQRTAISGSIGIDGNGFTPEDIIDAGADVLAGARVVVRPTSWFHLAGTVDQSLFGSSTSTWSAGADANVQIGSRVLVTAGWRTLTQQREAISTVMHGPRVALQLLF